MMGSVRLMQYAWSDNPREVEYFFPDSWDVTVYNIAGARRPALTDTQIEKAVLSPIGSPSIRDLAKGKKKVCILFDDMARGTPTWRIAPFVLRELKVAGIPDDAIEFICATGAHQSWDRSALVKKVGEHIMATYPVFNHVPFFNCTPLGKTSFETKVEINSEVMSCDLKIAIGDISPHVSYGFSGGGKMIMPGVASYDSIVEHHGVVHRPKGLPGTPDPDFRSANNPNLRDAIEFARMAGLDFSIHCMLNHKAEVVAIFAGDVEASQIVAIEEAKKHFLVPPTGDNDITIANAFCKANEANIASGVAFNSVTRRGGTAVLVANSHLGQIGHYLFGNWGRAYGGKVLSKMSPPEWVKHCIFYTEFPEARNRDRFVDKDLDRVTFPSQWADVIDQLMVWHGTSAKVAVFPDATNQL
jgi:nickel-dependent lactate racemase